MISGFRTYGGGAQDNFIDMTNINAKSKMRNEQEVLPEGQKEKKAKLKVSRAAAKQNFISGKDAVQREIGKAYGIAIQHQQPSFSREQEMLGEMFGQGEKIWGTNQEPVTINNDLNSSRSDPFDETAGMFGFGGGGERSGLF